MHDHRKLGRELDLFDTDPLIGSGLPVLAAGRRRRPARPGGVHPGGRAPGRVPARLLAGAGQEGAVRDLRALVALPGRHVPADGVGGEQVVLRPSLCPHHALIYRSRGHSYRELPLRIAELGGDVPRRAVRRARRADPGAGDPAQRRAYLLHPGPGGRRGAGRAGADPPGLRRMGISPARYRLSLAGAGGKYVAAPGQWQRAAELLTEVLDGRACAYETAAGEAAFYGPKIDVQVADARAGRPPCPPSRSTSTSPRSSASATPGQTGPPTGRSWFTAASSAARSGRSPACWRSTGAPSRPGSPPFSWLSSRSPTRSGPRPRRSWPAASTRACGPGSPGRRTAAWAPASGPPGWSPTRPWSAPGRPPAAWSPCACGTAAAWPAPAGAGGGPHRAPSSMRASPGAVGRRARPG